MNEAKKITEHTYQLLTSNKSIEGIVQLMQGMYDRL